MIYSTDKDSEIYRSKEWYEVLPMEEIQARREAFLKRGLTIDGRGVAVNSLKLTVNSNHKVQSSMFKVIDFRALTAITLFMLALLFSLPNLVIAIVLMILISALLEIIKMLAEWQPKKMAEWLPQKQVRRIS